MQERVDQHRECSQSDFLMPPWKNDKKGREVSDTTMIGRPDHGAWAVAGMLFPLLIRALCAATNAAQ